jgi:hypothetical protein
MLPAMKVHSALQRGEVGLSLASVVEVEVDHDVVGIVGGAQDPAATAPAKWTPPCLLR